MAAETATAPPASEGTLYQPLENGQIRLLKLHGTRPIATRLSGTPDIAINCSLHIVSKDEIESGRVSYRALSYVWGESQAPRWVFCNGHQHRITRNLHDALWQFSNVPETVPEYLWVDAICINQEDLTEKGRQVELIGDIYRQAELVLIWLGAYAHMAVGKLDQRVWTCSAPSEHTELMKLDTLPKFNPDDCVVAAPGGFEDRVEYHMMEFDPSNHAMHNAQLFIAESSYMQRMWTLQEIVLSKAAQFHCGPFHLDWERLIDTPWLIPFGLQVIQYLRSFQEKWPLLYLLSVTAERDSSNPLDKVYALLGLTDTPLKPDYNMTELELSARVTVAIARQHGWLSIGQFTLREDFEYWTESHKRLYIDFQFANISKPESSSWIHGWTRPDQSNVIFDNRSQEFEMQWFIAQHQNTLRFSVLRFDHLGSSYANKFTLKGTNLIARGALLGIWEQVNSKIGYFRSIPECVRRSARSPRDDEGRAHRKESAVVEASDICALWLKHLERDCHCKGLQPDPATGASDPHGRDAEHANMRDVVLRPSENAAKHVDKGATAAPPHSPSREQAASSRMLLAMVFGCQDIIVVQKSNHSAFELLGVLNPSCAWSSALRQLSKNSRSMARFEDKQMQIVADMRTRRTTLVTANERPLADMCEKLDWFVTDMELVGDGPAKTVDYLGFIRPRAGTSSPPI